MCRVVVAMVRRRPRDGDRYRNAAFHFLSEWWRSSFVTERCGVPINQLQRSTNQGGRKLLLVETSLCCCDLRSSCRQMMIRVAFSTSFNVAVMIVVAINAVVIALDDFSDPMMAAQQPPQTRNIQNQLV